MHFYDVIIIARNLTEEWLPSSHPLRLLLRPLQQKQQQQQHVDSFHHFQRCRCQYCCYYYHYYCYWCCCYCHRRLWHDPFSSLPLSAAANALPPWPFSAHSPPAQPSSDVAIRLAAAAVRLVFAHAPQMLF